MGWKNVKEHYRIEHAVQITGAGLCIGSPYIHDLIIIGMDGKFIKRDGKTGWSQNADLKRYQDEMDADPETLHRLIETPDTFAVSKIVYTFDGGTILEKLCEEYEWPNVTHDGLMMYDNRFSPDKAKVVAWAKRDAKIGIEYSFERITELNAQIEAMRLRRDMYEANLKALCAEYPGEG